MELQGSLPPHLLPHLTFLAGHGDPNSGPHAYMEAIFPDDRSPHFLFSLEMVLVHSLGWSSICCAAQAAPTFLFLYFSCGSHVYTTMPSFIPKFQGPTSSGLWAGAGPITPFRLCPAGEI